MIRKDDRTPEQRATHRWAVVGRDTFMSGWGGAQGGYSRAAWTAADDANFARLEDWVRRRGDMKYVTVVDLRTYRPRRGTAHFHIYVAGPDHPAFA